jgi:small multidrug resistance family-3 protein
MGAERGAERNGLTQNLLALDGGLRSAVDPLHARPMLPFMKTILLYVITAIAEIVGCYLPYRWLKEDGSPWLLVPGALSLALFAWLLTLHASAAGRVYAAYGGVYIAVAIMWLWAVERIRPSSWDWAGMAIALVGMSVIAFQPRG